MNHIIKKQVIDLRIQQKLNSFDAQQQVSKYYLEKIIPVLEKIFDELAPGEWLIEMDQLEIDLGVIQLGEFQESSFSGAMEIQLREQFTKIVAKASGSKTIRRMPVALGRVRQWIFYMERGYLPWNGFQVDGKWLRQVLESFAVDYEMVSALRALILSSRSSRRRIIAQHDILFLVSLTEILTARKQDKLEEWMGVLVSLIRFSKERYGATGKTADDPPEYTAWSGLLVLSAGNSGQRSTEELFAEVSKQVLRRGVIGEILTHYTGNIPEEVQAIILDIRNEIPQQNLEEESEGRRFSEAEMLGEGIFVQHAGIVMLHPFFHSYTKRVGWVEEGRFLNESVRKKALYLMHFLVTGDLNPEEHELVMAKILCGVPITDPVDGDIFLTESEQEEAGHLLDAAIAQWEILKNTSRDGLREGFLQRNGKLYQNNGGLHLIVEKKAIDILLDHLPWGLGLVKLPWMNELLHVEWR